MKYKLTEKGKEKIGEFLKECQRKREFLWTESQKYSRQRDSGMSEYALIGTNSQNLLVRDEQLLRLSEVPSIGTTVPHGRGNSLNTGMDTAIFWHRKFKSWLW